MVTTSLNLIRYVGAFRQIIDWSREPSRGVGPFTSKLMETTTFNDLHVRLGHPYLYLHQGDCEHLIIFSDIRFVCLFICDSS